MCFKFLEYFQPYTNLTICFKGAVSIISCDPPWNDDNACFTTVPLKTLSDQVWIMNPGFCFMKLLFYTLIKTLWTRKTTLSSTFLIRWRYQGYRCKTSIVIVAWRVTWNYAYSPFLLAWLIPTIFSIVSKAKMRKWPYW